MTTETTNADFNDSEEFLLSECLMGLNDLSGGEHSPQWETWRDVVANFIVLAAKFGWELEGHSETGTPIFRPAGTDSDAEEFEDGAVTMPSSSVAAARAADAEPVRQLRVKLPLPLAHDLDDLKILRQREAGRSVTKGSLVVEAIRNLVSTSK